MASGGGGASPLRGMNYDAGASALKPAAVIKPVGGGRAARGALVVQRLSGWIKLAAKQFRVPAELVGAIVMHESQARERQELGGGWVADQAERAETLVRGDKASIGIAQMQVGVAKKTAKNHPNLRGRGSVVDDLLNERTACRYVAARPTGFCRSPAKRGCVRPTPAGRWRSGLRTWWIGYSARS